jgi:UDP-N-acetylmuramyl pentapeptide phosphotransferase/UDP-N-acetylglucosamine-1-phosphate transferase
MFGIEDIHYVISLLFTLIVIIGIVNAYNLIDGIDGLASGLGILASTFFGGWFCLTGHIQFSIMSFALAGSLSAFFLYNVFGHKNKLFIGDTGSLVLGLLVSVMVIQFNEFSIEKTTYLTFTATPAVSFAAIIVPVIDTLRVMCIRISCSKSPFSPDKNHFHHRLLNVVPNHLKVTLTIISIHVFMIALAMLLNFFSFHVTVQFLFIFLTGIIMLSVISMLIKKSGEKKNEIYTPVRKPVKLTVTTHQKL